MTDAHIERHLCEVCQGEPLSAVILILTGGADLAGRAQVDPMASRPALTSDDAEQKTSLVGLCGRCLADAHELGLIDLVETDPGLTLVVGGPR